MINEEKTYSKYGYYSYELAPKSHKKIVAVCNKCSKERDVVKSAYRDLCQRCAMIDRLPLMIRQSNEATKGKPRSEETKKKISESNFGKKMSPESILKAKMNRGCVKGQNNPFYGKHHTEESKRLLSIARRGKNCKLSPGEAARNKVVSYYRRSAKKKNLEFTLNDQQLKQLFAGNCHYCGCEPSTIYRHGSNGEFVYNGIDRKNNDLGYIIDNCVSCCTLCNFSKRNLSYNNFLKYINKLYNHLKDKINDLL